MSKLCRFAKDKTHGLLIFCMLLLAGAMILSGPALAEDVKDLYKQADKQLRQAQKDMFAGNKDQAVAALDGIRDLLVRAKEADPNNPSVKTYENKYKNLVKDLERRTGKDLGGGSLTAAKSSSQGPAAAEKPEVKPMPEKKAETAPAATAGGGQDLAKQADGLLRQAERSMHGGKNQEALDQLNQAKELVAQLKAADPQNAKLATLENKAGQLEKNLASKTAKADAAPAQQSGAPAGSSAKKDDKLPYGARQFMRQLTPITGRTDSYISRMKDPQYPGDKNQLVGNAEQNLAEGRKLLTEARKAAAEKGMESHPDLEKVQADLDEAEKKLALAKEELGQAQAQAQAQAGEVTTDVKALEDLYQKVDPVFRKAGGNVIYYNDLPPAQDLLKVIEEFEKSGQGPVREGLTAFTAKYGDSEQAIDEKTKSMGYSGQRASYFYTSLKDGLAKVAKTREVMADDLIRKAKEMQETSGRGIHDFFRLKNQAKIREYAQLAAQFQAENPRVKEFMGGLEEWMKKDAEALQAKIGKAAWPKQAADAPGDAGKLAKAALEFLQQAAEKETAKGKEPRRVVAVVVSGPWRIFKKNILGEVIQWGLPVYVAEEWESDKAAGLVRVYNMSMLTQEVKGVKQAPPYIGAAVGDSFYLKLSAVK